MTNRFLFAAAEIPAIESRLFYLAMVLFSDGAWPGKGVTLMCLVSVGDGLRFPTGAPVAYATTTRTEIFPVGWLGHQLILVSCG